MLKVSEDGDTLRAVGDGKVTLSAYGIERPSQLGVTTADDVKLRFDLTAKQSATRAVATSGRQMSVRAIARSFAAATAILLVGRPASALPTMVRLGYTDCASCHIAPQGGGPLNAYGRGIDEAQSLRARDYQPKPDQRLLQDVRLVLQEQGTWANGQSGVNFFRPRLMYRNVTNLSGAFRVSATVTAEGADAPRPAVTYDPASRSSTLFVNTALVHYRPRESLEFAAGRDQLPSGVNVPDLAMFVRSRNRLGYYDAPTQLKMYWGGKRYHVMPFVYAPAATRRRARPNRAQGHWPSSTCSATRETIAGLTDAARHRGQRQSADGRRVCASRVRPVGHSGRTRHHRSHSHRR